MLANDSLEWQDAFGLPDIGLGPQLVEGLWIEGLDVLADQAHDGTEITSMSNP